MNSNQMSDENGKRHEAEETLRRLATLPEPDHLTGRVHARLAEAARNAPPVRDGFWRGFWSQWLPAQRLQFAGAAALLLAVAGGSAWTLHRQHETAASAAYATPAPIQSNPVQSNQVQSNSVQSTTAPAIGDFKAAGTARVPPTLNPIKVPPAPRRKPAAAHAAVKPLPKPANATGTTQIP